MKRRQLIFILAFSILLSSAIVALAVPGTILGQMTIPTRTPVPDPKDPTDPPPKATDDNGDDNNDPPTPTDRPPVQSSSTPISRPTDTTRVSGPTSVPTSNVTPTPTPTIVERASVTATAAASATSIRAELAPGTTPIAFPVVATAFPTAQPCGEPPTFTTLTTAQVYSGPGDDYDLIETLLIDETRPIVGRAIYSTWWLIQLDGKFHQAWIDDNLGIAEGNTNNIIEVPAPEIDGLAPTPGLRWDPTPVHVCELTATATATSSIDQIVSGVINDGNGESGETNSSGSSESATDQINSLAATAAPLDIPTAAPTPNLLPIAGLVLIIAAVFVALFLRRNPGGGEPSQ